MMPFPVIDRKRYFQYAFGIGSLLVSILNINKFSSFILTTIMFSLKMSDLEHSEISSHSLLLHCLARPTVNTNNKS